MIICVKPCWYLTIRDRFLELYYEMQTHLRWLFFRKLPFLHFEMLFLMSPCLEVYCLILTQLHELLYSIFIVELLKPFYFHANSIIVFKACLSAKETQMY